MSALITLIGLLKIILTIVATAPKTREVGYVTKIEYNSSLKLRIGDEKVKIQVYYESLCPGSRRFDTTQLTNVNDKLQDYLDIHTYPYGNAKTIVNDDGTVTITCQHGELECYGNMLHACAIDILANVTAFIKFNACLMDTNRKLGSDDAAADECGQQLGVDAASIKACAKGQKGKDLLKYYGDETHKIKIAYVPFVLINGVHRPVDGDVDFMTSVCKEFKEKPAPCK